MAYVTVELGQRRYDILIGEGLLHGIGELIRALSWPGAATAVVTDSNVWRIHGAAFTDSMERAGAAFTPIVMEAGEGSKSMAGLERLYSAFAAMKLRRDGLVAAFGGGVVGDLAGFAAATWMRGVRHVQAPTSLLAQVDSSVGGKTAINTAEGKNLAGAFHQPSLVVADTALLATLPPRELRCGMAEVIKYGAIMSKPLFERVCGPLDRGGLAEAVGDCCRIKAGIVERDEFDTDERALLNFGHTFGHALEKLGGYARHSHGEAVAIGMVMAAEAGEKAGLTAKGCADALRAALAAHGLETECGCRPEELLPHMGLDKKGRGGGAVGLVLLEDIGEAMVHEMRFEELEKLLAH
jgi:3-dehydroquinate synthase